MRIADDGKDELDDCDEIDREITQAVVALQRELDNAANDDDDDEINKRKLQVYSPSGQATADSDGSDQPHYICCLNRCSFVRVNRQCNVCMPRTYNDQPQRIVCLCDCLTFQYCMLWRGEYLRNSGCRYSYGDTGVAQPEDRLMSYSLEDTVCLGSAVFGRVYGASLLTSVLADMGFTPNDKCAWNDEGFRSELRCHRCFSVMDVNSLLLKPRESNETTTELASSSPGSLSCADTFGETSQRTVRLLDLLLRELNRLHSRANPFCPYVMHPFDEPEATAKYVTQYKLRYRFLVLYTTPNTLPSLGAWGVTRYTTLTDSLFRGDDATMHCRYNRYWPQTMTGASTENHLRRTRPLVEDTRIDVVPYNVDLLTDRRRYGDRQFYRLYIKGELSMEHLLSRKRKRDCGDDSNKDDRLFRIAIHLANIKATRDAIDDMNEESPSEWRTIIDDNGNNDDDDDDDDDTDEDSLLCHSEFEMSDDTTEGDHDIVVVVNTLNCLYFEDDTLL